jgi:hypothetical protein
MRIAELIPHMSAEDLLQATHQMQSLQVSTAWKVLAAGLQESLEEADALLHETRADDTVTVAMAQATHSALKQLIEAPAEMVRQYTEAFEAVGALTLSLTEGD